jgi:16S rRNA (cytidine1402-2'-O)-methyltransferase
VPVIAIPGPNAAIAALSAAGLPSDEFFFAGFLPSKRQARRTRLSELGSLTSTLVFYESPHRILEMLTDLQEILGDRDVCVAREVTKIHEEYIVGKLSEVAGRINPRGEFVVIAGGVTEQAQDVPKTRQDVLKRLGMTRNQLYDLFFKKPGGQDSDE